METAAPVRASRREIERSLDASRREGVASQVTVGILDCYLVPFVLYLGAGTREIGWLSAVPGFLSALSQFFVVDVLRAVGNRRRLLLWSTAAQVLLLAPLPALAAVRVPGRFAAVFALVAAFRVIGAVMGPPWGSLMSDYLPERRRGRYFGGRSQLVGVSGLASTAACGVLLYTLHSRLGSFVALFGAAAAFRFVSFRYMSRLVDLPEHHERAEAFDWRSARRRLRRSNTVRFVAYVASITFAAQLSAAYLSVHMLRDLHFDYLRYTVVQAASAAAGFLSFPAWGRHADVVGNARVMRLNSFLLPLIPVLWCATESTWGLALVEAFGGFAWAGFNLCTTNFLYDSVPAPKRVRALGYFNLVNGAALFLGGVLGGRLADVMPPVGGYRLHGLFLLAAAARLAADLLLSRRFEEVRPARERASSARLFFSVVGVRPLVGPNVDQEWEPPADLDAAPAR